MIGSRLPALFWLLALTNLFVGGMVGLERTLVPLLATDVFHLAAGGAALAFIASFGIAKALGNLAVGALADRYGRLTVLRRLASGLASATGLTAGAELDGRHPRQRAARRTAGPDVVDDHQHEDRLGRASAARPGDRAE
ncbi:hypothetical protein [Deinococcus sp. UYEF24]